MSNDTTTTSDRFIRLNVDADGCALLVRVSSISAAFAIGGHSVVWFDNGTTEGGSAHVRESVDEIARLLAGEAST